jgi:hypothetical protein
VALSEGPGGQEPAAALPAIAIRPRIRQGGNGNGSLSRQSFEVLYHHPDMILLPSLPEDGERLQITPSGHLGLGQVVFVDITHILHASGYAQLVFGASVPDDQF